MPDFRFHLPRFLRSQRSSRSHSHSSSADLGNDATTSDSPNSSPTPAFSPRPSSRQRALEPDTHDAMSNSHSPAPTSLAYPKDPPHLHAVGTAGRDSAGQPLPVSSPITSISASEFSPPDLASQPPTGVPHLLVSTESTSFPHSSCSFGTPVQQFLPIERQILDSADNSTPSRYQSQEVFKNAHDFSVMGSNFIDNAKGNMTLMNYYNTTNQFMEKLLKETIPGAGADSSARDPPPRCHPGTRLAILERCIDFIAHCNGVQKIRWVVGAAGVGKSAVMQSVTESRQLAVVSQASVFLSINGRSEGARTIITLSYQFAAKSQSYRRAIEDEVNRDPSLLQSSMAIQFERFIVQPFIHNPDINSAGRVLIIIDGLDECNDTRTQVELLRLIAGFCISYSSSPIVWIIASRPEPHIVSFFAKPEVIPAYEKEEIAVDTNEARADVERFLRHELKEIARESDSLEPSWPDEQHLWKLANAAGGLFAYAQTVVRYIGDPNFGDPASQLSDVINVIDDLPMSELSREEHPMALLDALYARILSNIPRRTLANTRKLLLALVSQWGNALQNQRSFIVLCNWLGMTADEAYAALNRLRSVLDFPRRHEAHENSLKPFHKSFVDHIVRSGFFADVKVEARQIMVQCAFRVLEEAPDGVDLDVEGYGFVYGRLACHTGVRGNISVSWPAHKGMSAWDDSQTRLNLYQLAIGEVAAEIKRGNPVFLSESYIKLLTTAFEVRYDSDLFYELRDVVFDESRRHGFLEYGILKQLPAKAIKFSAFDRSCDVKIQFHHCGPTTTLVDLWEPSCEHTRVGQGQNWNTVFDYFDCSFCYDRLERQFEGQVSRSADHDVHIMFTSASYCCVEFKYADPDNASEWTYWFWLFLSQDGRKALGSTI